jgi:RHS repeat-associated protein
MTMTYDAFGRMAEKYDGTSYWQELFSPIGPVALMKGQAVSQLRVPLPGRATALSGINFEHKDWLGNASFVSNRNRTSTAARLFSPYGEIYNNTGSTGDVDFTGDRQDLTAGLYDTPNRELNPSGRWISPDPAHARWNAYSYSTNPLGETDPSGLGAAGVNNFVFGAPPEAGGGGGDAVGLRQPDMDELAFGGEFAGSVWDFNFGMEGIYSPSMTPSGGNLCCVGGGGGTIGGGTVWNTGISAMGFTTPGNEGVDWGVDFYVDTPDSGWTGYDWGGPVYTPISDTFGTDLYWLGQADILNRTVRFKRRRTRLRSS